MTTQSDVRAELQDLEHEGWEALCGPGGAGFYETVMAPDGVMVFPGMVMDRATSLETMRSVTPWSRFELRDISVVADGDVGLVTYLATATRGDEPAYEATMSSVYVRRDGKWRLLLHQQSPRSVLSRPT